MLLGIRGTEILWKQQFPLKESINVAKSSIECGGRVIKIDSQIPFHSYTTTQLFSWDGQTLKNVTTESSDQTLEAIEESIRIAESGDAEKVKFFFERPEDEIVFFYPHQYIHEAALSKAIKRGRLAAARIYRTSNARAAANRLALMFELTVRLSQVVNLDYYDDNPVLL